MAEKIKHLISATAFVAFIVLAIASSEDKIIEWEVSESSSPPIEVSSRQLFYDYESNEVAADQKYKEKILVVTGKIASIGKDITDNIYITLATDDIFGEVQCLFADTHSDVLAKLSKGQKVTIKGKCDGKMMNVFLRGCILQ